jgi:hypothetical protein
MASLDFNAHAYFQSLLNRRSFANIGVLAQVEVASQLESDGFEVAAEVYVPGYLRNGTRRGRIDLLAHKGDLFVGIEIDRWEGGKAKSVHKLACFAGLTHRVLLVNCDEGGLDGQVSSRHAQFLDFFGQLRVYAADDSLAAAGSEAWRALSSLRRAAPALLQRMRRQHSQARNAAVVVNDGPNAGKRWSQDDDASLRTLWSEATANVQDLAQTFGRTVPAILSRLVKIGIFPDADSARAAAAARERT